MTQQVRLMLTCLCDAFYGEVGIATVRVLEHLGCQVAFGQEQTCCGQPAFNAGDWPAARLAAEHARGVLFRSGEPVVTPSASCASMVREYYPMLFEGIDHPEIYELGEFIVRVLGVNKMPITIKSTPPNRKIAFHSSCHGRGLGLKGEQQSLIAGLPWIEMVPFEQAEQCCGFGGAFSTTHGSISAAIGMEKLRNIMASGVGEIVSGDMGCLMQLSGLIARNHLPLKVRHFAELLAEAIEA